jgi:Ca2+:H+ antiporter
MNLEALRSVGRWNLFTLGSACLAFAVMAVAKALGAGDVTQFVLAGVSLATLAAVIGQAMDAIAERMGPGATGLLQSTLGNLPELFVGYFALKEGLTSLVQAALVGSVLANAVLVMGIAFLAGGVRHGVQRFDAEEPRLYANLLLLVVAALLIPTLAVHLSTPAGDHAVALSGVCSVVLLVVYAVSVPYFLRKGPVPEMAPLAAPVGPTEMGRSWASEPKRATTVGEGPASDSPEHMWPFNLSVVILTVASIGAAVAADWFVTPLQSASQSLGLSETFTGLVVVALASNAVEHAVGIRFAFRAKPAYAVSTCLNSPLQVALLLTPVLVLLSHFVGPSELTLVFSPMLVATLAMSSLVVTFVIYDGEYSWLEGAALVGLYVMIATSFWWG